MRRRAGIYIADTGSLQTLKRSALFVFCFTRLRSAMIEIRDAERGSMLLILLSPTNMIELYTTAKGFLFLNRKEKQVGSMAYDTMELVFTKAATEEDKDHMRSYAKGFIRGEVLLHSGKSTVLGPARDYTHEVTLRAAGNPDMQQWADIGPRKTVLVCGVEEARQVVLDYQAHHIMGIGNCSEEHGVVWQRPVGGKGRRRKVAKITYNGTIMTNEQVKEMRDAAQAVKANGGTRQP